MLVCQALGDMTQHSNVGASLLHSLLLETCTLGVSSSRHILRASGLQVGMSPAAFWVQLPDELKNQTKTVQGQEGWHGGTWACLFVR